MGRLNAQSRAIQVPEHLKCVGQGLASSLVLVEYRSHPLPGAPMWFITPFSSRRGVHMFGIGSKSPTIIPVEFATLSQQFLDYCCIVLSKLPFHRWRQMRLGHDGDHMLDSFLPGDVSFENTIDELPEVCRWEGTRSCGVAGVGIRHSSMRRACSGRNYTVRG